MPTKRGQRILFMRKPEYWQIVSRESPNFGRHWIILYCLLKLICEAAGGGKVSEELKRFVELVLEERREKFLQFMIMSYIDLYRKQKNISVGKITTVCPVAEEVVNRIRALVVEKTHGTVEFKTKIDPKLEGGFIFEIGTYRLDASVANQIKRVKQQFIAKNRRIV